MKRITSLDFLRGLAMFLLIGYHAFEKTIHPTFFTEVMALPPALLALFAPLLLLANWRGIFLLISGATLTYRTHKSIEKGIKPMKIFIQNFLSAILLLIHGLVIQAIWNPYSGAAYIYLRSGVVNWSSMLRQLQWSDAVEMIALGIAFTSIINIFLVTKKTIKRPKLVSLAYIFFAAVIFFLTPVAQNWLFTRYGLETSGVQYMTTINFRERMESIVLALFIGEQQPFFPFAGVFCIGNIFGILFAQPKLHKKKTLLYGYLSGLLLIILGVLIFVFIDKMVFDPEPIVRPMWFLIVNLGLQVIAMMIFMGVFEFNKKCSQRASRTKFIRRIGIIPLTLFTFQVLDYFPGLLLLKLFNQDFTATFGLEFKWSLLFTAVSMAFWAILVLLWGLLQNYLTMDWLFAMVKSLIFWKKPNWKDPLHTEVIIKNPDPVQFVHNQDVLQE